LNIQEAANFLNFWINKNTGNWYTISELMEVIDRGQMALYNDYQPQASTSQRIKDALSPFKDTYDFTPSSTLLGIVTVPSNLNYLNLLDLSIRYAISGRSLTKQVPVQIYNEDERSDRLDSQIDPVAVTTPIAEQMGDGVWQLYPVAQYFGTVTFYRRPVKPVFAYTVVSGRVIVYDSANSTQLEWKETQITEILLKGLSSIGINLSQQDLQQWSEIKTQQNYQNVNHL
jgi:hypothetical protein